MLHVTHSFSRAPTPTALRPWKRAPVPRRRPVSSDGASSSAFGKDEPSIAGKRAANDKTYEFSKISSKHPTLAPEDAPPGRSPSEGETLSEANTRWARPPPGDPNRVRLADAPCSTGAPRARCLERASLHLPPRRTCLPSEEARSRRPPPSTLRRATIESCPSLEEPHAEASSRERSRRSRLVAPHRLSLRHTDRNTTYSLPSPAGP